MVNGKDNKEYENIRCDKVSEKMRDKRVFREGKVYKMVLRPVMLFGPVFLGRDRWIGSEFNTSEGQHMLAI